MKRKSDCRNQDKGLFTRPYFSIFGSIRFSRKKFYMTVRDCATQYHFIMITHRALPTENEIVSEVLYDRR